jgi:hypothetical protein
VYTEFTKKKDCEQLTVSVSARTVTPAFLSVKNSRSPNANELTLNFSIVSYMRILFQIQDQYCFSLTTKQQIIREFICNKALGAFHLYSPPC